MMWLTIWICYLRSYSSGVFWDSKMFQLLPLPEIHLAVTYTFEHVCRIANTFPRDFQCDSEAKASESIENVKMAVLTSSQQVPVRRGYCTTIIGLSTWIFHRNITLLHLINDYRITLDVHQANFVIILIIMKDMFNIRCSSVDLLKILTTHVQHYFWAGQWWFN